MTYIDAIKEVKDEHSLTGYRDRGSYSGPVNADCFVVTRTMDIALKEQEQVAVTLKDSRKSANPRSITVSCPIEAAVAIAHAVLAVAQGHTDKLEGTLRSV